MITNPKHGWCDFSLGGFTGHPSYLTDVPLDLLQAFIDYYERGSGVCPFDEEGKDFLLVLDQYTSRRFIIGPEYDQVCDLSDLNVEDMAEELLQDIEGNGNLAGWQYFTTWADDEEKVKMNRYNLRDKASKLRKILKKI